MLIGLNTVEAINRQKPFFNTSGSYYYIQLKLNIAREVIFFHQGGLIIKGEVYIPETLESIHTLSMRYNIPKSSVGRAIQNIYEDGGWLERVGNHGKGVKYQILLTPDKAQAFLDHYSSTLQTKKIKKMARAWSRWDIQNIKKKIAMG